MPYRVISAFADLQDNGHVYEVGDEYPREGMVISKERFAELSSSDNKRGIPLIEKVTAKKKK